MSRSVVYYHWLNVNISPSRLFTFTHGRVAYDPNSRTPGRLDKTPSVASVVVVAFTAGSPQNDLVSCMENILTSRVNDVLYYDVIITPSDAIGFQLNRRPTTSKLSPDPFVYPKTIFLDRFLFCNFVLTNEKRALEQSMQEEIRELVKHKETLTRFNVSIP